MSAWQDADHYNTSNSREKRASRHATTANALVQSMKNNLARLFLADFASRTSHDRQHSAWPPRYASCAIC